MGIKRKETKIKSLKKFPVRDDIKYERTRINSVTKQIFEK